MKLKPDVKVQGLRPEILLAIMVAKDAYKEAGTELVITSLVDGKHSETSLHYTGCAVDIRTRNLPQNFRDYTQIRIRDALTRDYDVVLEKDHIHIEYQPRR